MVIISESGTVVTTDLSANVQCVQSNSASADPASESICSICQKSYSDESAMKAHYVKHHTGHCRVCSNPVVGEEMDTHYINVHRLEIQVGSTIFRRENEKTLWKCYICDSVKEKTTSFISHLAESHRFRSKG